MPLGLFFCMARIFWILFKCFSVLKSYAINSIKCICLFGQLDCVCVCARVIYSYNPCGIIFCEWHAVGFSVTFTFWVFKEVVPTPSPLLLWCAVSVLKKVSLCTGLFEGYFFCSLSTLASEPYAQSLALSVAVQVLPHSFLSRLLWLFWIFAFPCTF